MKFRAVATTLKSLLLGRQGEVIAESARRRELRSVAAPTEKHPVQYFSKVDANLFRTSSRNITTGMPRNIPDPICRRRVSHV